MTIDPAAKPEAEARPTLSPVGVSLSVSGTCSTAVSREA
jgi:hypothetical protein